MPIIGNGYSGYLANIAASAYHTVAQKIFPEPVSTPELTPEQQRSQKNEKFLMAEKAVVYSGPVQLLEINGLMDQRVNAENASDTPLYNPDGNFARLADIDWSDFSPGNLKLAMGALSNEILRPLGHAYYGFTGHSHEEILSSPELQQALDKKGDLKAGAANFIKVASQLILARLNSGQSGVGQAYQSASTTMQTLAPFLGTRGFQNWLAAFDRLANNICTPAEIQQRQGWTKTLLDEAANPLQRLDALIFLIFSNWGTTLATGLYQGVQHVQLSIQAEKDWWHHLRNDDVEKVLKDAIGPKFKATATEKILAWIALTLAGLEMHGPAAAVYLYRHYVYASLGYRWVPSLSRKTWQTLFGKNSTLDGNVSREYLLQISLYSGKTLLSINSLITTAYLGLSHFFSNEPITAKLLYDESIQAAHESPVILNYGISGLALLLGGVGFAFQGYDIAKILNRIRKDEPAKPNEFNMGNGLQLISSVLGTGGALSSWVSVWYLGSNLNGPAFMFYTGLSGIFMLGQGGIKYREQIVIGARNLLSRLR